MSKPRVLRGLRHCTLLAVAGLAALVASGAESNNSPKVERTKGTAPAQRVTRPANTNLLASYQIKPGFRLEMVAGELLVTAPVAMAFDENGRLFVLESPEVAVKREQRPAAARIRLLEDTDGDGLFDASAVFAENLPLASGLACASGGVLVLAPPDLVYFKSSRGERRADLRQVVATGFEAPSNAPALINGLIWGPDNRFHGAAEGGVIKSLNAAGAEAVTLGTGGFSLDPLSWGVASDVGMARSGLSFDHRGRKFLCDPNRPLRLAMYDLRYTARNPFFPRQNLWVDVASPATTIFRQAPLETLRPSATDPRGTNLEPVLVSVPTWFTNARSALIYRGSAFPTNYLDNIFTADPEAHLIHRALLRDTGLEPMALRAPDEARTEFLLSTNATFHPMHLAAGPDGALYVADFHLGAGGGRIFRIAPVNFEPPPPPKLGKAGTYDLVVALAHTNGWHRDTATRLLCERRDPAAAQWLSNMLSNSRLPLARLQALRALSGLEALKEAHLLRALRDPDDRLRESAIRLAELFVREGQVSDPLWTRLRALTADPSGYVRYQLAFTLGEISRPERVAALVEILKRDPDNRWLQTAILSSAGDVGAELFMALAADAGFRNDARGQEWLRQIGTMVAVRAQPNQLGPLLDFLVHARLDARETFTWLTVLGEGLRQAGSALAAVDGRNVLQPIYDATVDPTLNDTLPDPVRLAAIRLRGVSPYTAVDTGGFFQLLFGTGQSEAIQAAALTTLGHYDNPRIPATLFDRWQVLTPRLRQVAVRVLLARPDRAAAVLAALDQQRIALTDLTSPQMDLLRTHDAPAIRERALQLLGPITVQRTAVLESHKPALRLVGVATRGRQIFQTRCAACHTLGSNEPLAGPDLVALRPRGKERILISIIEPNLELTSDHVTCVAQTKTGEIVVGVLGDQTEVTSVLRQANGVQLVFPRANLQSVLPQNWSLMPAGLESGLGPQGLADLLEYLMTGTTRTP